jgi:hypothetical protein
MFERLFFLTTGLLAVLITITSCAEDTREAGTSPPAAAAPQAIKVLVRNRNTGMLAVDGFLFQVHMLTTANSEGLKDQLWLKSDPTMNVQDENGLEYRSPAGDKQTPTPIVWRLDPKDFDFFVTWTVDSVEQKKANFNADLVIAVKEDWKVEKVSDPAITKTWTCSYTLRAPSRFEKGLLEKTSFEETNSHILPARSPIIRELRAFIEANK